MNSDSTAKATRKKPDKPYADYPLTAHLNGQWSKKIKQHVYYFGPWDDPEGAINEYNRQKEQIFLTGKKLEAVRGQITLHELANHFMAHNQTKLDDGDMAPRTFKRYKDNGQMVLDHFGKNVAVESLQPEHFQALRTKMAKRWGPVALATEIQMTRTMFKFGVDNLDVTAKFGTCFQKPKAKTLRNVRNEKGVQMFTPAQVKSLLKVATINMRAMIFLGLNCALGNTEIAMLPIAALDLEGGWMDYARVKTAVPRRIPLWKETIAAIKDVIANRCVPNDPADAGLVFIARRGGNYIANHKGTRIHSEFSQALTKAEVEGRAFYDFRRTFETIGGDSLDQVAVNFIMGHAPTAGDMPSIYRQMVPDHRLLAVTTMVHDWLYGTKKKA